MVYKNYQQAYDAVEVTDALRIKHPRGFMPIYLDSIYEDMTIDTLQDVINRVRARAVRDRIERIHVTIECHVDAEGYPREDRSAALEGYVPESDAQWEARLRNILAYDIWNKGRRREDYERLKQEFENEQSE